ncbi:hypothetical protein L2E82_36607 [Cichorium intybus]|uniref:Uncharacterized protein n=1 Tax=Cichorium intybus TaxID=13427 RepID=A0ACB9ADU3_CICIN|nr:hypothetical protein L2E82_36607 [Cichorium intybus]
MPRLLLRRSSILVTNLEISHSMRFAVVHNLCNIAKGASHMERLSDLESERDVLGKENLDLENSVVALEEDESLVLPLEILEHIKVEKDKRLQVMVEDLDWVLKHGVPG